MKAILFFLLTAYCSLLTVEAQTRDYTRHVNPFIGTGGHGHTFPGATMPFGMVQLSPDTRIDNWDGSSGYHYSDDTIYGFSHTHLNGTGIPDYCDILITPQLGYLNHNWKPHKFSHADEKASPGYYAVKLEQGKIHAELTSTPRVGMHRYIFAEPGSIDLNLAWRDKLLGADFQVIGKNRVEGFRSSASWAKDQAIYFVIEFSRPFNEWIVEEPRLNPTKSRAKANFYFKSAGRLEIKVAISHVSIEGARKNLAAELPGWDFEKVRADAKAAWNRELSKIDVSGGTPDQTTTFYTALYHTMIQPNIFNDVDGSYLGMDKKVHSLSQVRKLGPERTAPGAKSDRGVAPSGTKKDSPGDQYTVFSLWDTFRAAHPLYTIIDQKRTVDFINTFIRQYEQGGRLPVWELAGEETDTMIGYHAVSVIADAMAKGIPGFDYE
ncbi:MAG: glycoside hydrolase domain-containing protein, partial [Pyrinomonadaceae bacterium]